MADFACQLFSCAFLPSSFSMTMNTFAMAAYLKEKWYTHRLSANYFHTFDKYFFRFFAIFFTCVSAMVGWPFAAVLGFPIVAEMLIFRARRLFLRFVGWSALSTAIVLPPLYFVDSYYYGKSVIVSFFLTFISVVFQYTFFIVSNEIWNKKFKNTLCFLLF